MPIIADKTFDEYIESVKEAKKKKLLHNEVEHRIKQLLSKLYPDACIVQEISAVLGGRNDLMQYSFNGRNVVFELFFSSSQVPQDLRLLEQSLAQVRIAILLDEMIDQKVSNDYFHKKPNAFPFLWLRFVMMPEWESYCNARLRELIDENSSINRLRRVLSHPRGNQFEALFQKDLEKVEVALGRQRTQDSRADLTVAQYLALKIVKQIRKLGMPLDRLRSLYAWLPGSIDRAINIFALGFQVFLITDLDGEHAIWSDFDLSDDLILGAEESDQAQIVICLNKIFNDFLVEIGEERSHIRWHIYYDYIEMEKLRPLVEKWWKDIEENRKTVESKSQD
jgi:hypothetical protein